jgi:hypothetical protein
MARKCLLKWDLAFLAVLLWFIGKLKRDDTGVEEVPMSGEGGRENPSACKYRSSLGN